MHITNITDVDIYYYIMVNESSVCRLCPAPVREYRITRRKKIIV